MKFLICGLGSIGQRHFRNLRSLGFEDIAVYRSGKGNKEFVEKFTDQYKPRVFNDLAAALAEKPDAVFVTNPTSLHACTALAAAEAGCDLFIEKPISEKLDGTVDSLIRTVEEKKLVALVGYHLRFHPGLIQVKRWLDAGKIGTPLSARAEFGERVESWHPWEDYRNSYACRADLGGGVILTQSHELDYLYWIFGAPIEVSGRSENRAHPDLDVEDWAEIRIDFASGLRAVAQLDYIQLPPARKLEISGSAGRIRWSFEEAEIIYHPSGHFDRWIAPRWFERNDVYMAELKHFLACLNGEESPINDLRQGKAVLEMAIKAKGGH